MSISLCLDDTWTCVFRFFLFFYFLHKKAESKEDKSPLPFRAPSEMVLYLVQSGIFLLWLRGSTILYQKIFQLLASALGRCLCIKILVSFLTIVCGILNTVLITQKMLYHCLISMGKACATAMKLETWNRLKNKFFCSVLSFRLG